MASSSLLGSASWLKSRQLWNPWCLSTTVILLILVLPLLTILIQLPLGNSEAWGHLAKVWLRDCLLNTAGLLLGTGSLTLICGVPLAWLVAACDFPGRRWLAWALLLPLAMPAYIVAITYAGILDYAGPLQLAWRTLMGPDGPRFPHLSIMNLPGLSMILAVGLYPFVYLSVRVALERQSRHVLEASRTLGRGPWQTWWRVTLPLARPAMVAGLSLVLMETLNDYGAASYYNVRTFATGIFHAWNGFHDLTAAVRLAAWLMAIILLLLVLERWQRGQASVSEGPHWRPVARHQLRGSQAWLATLACLAPLALGFLIPAAQLLYWSWLTWHKTTDEGLWQAAGNSIMVATLAAVVVVLSAILASYSARLYPSRWLRAISKLGLVGYAVPGAVIAIGVILPVTWLQAHGLAVAWSGALGVMLFAYVVRFLAVGFNPVEAGFKRLCGGVEEASRSLGAGPWRTLLRINLPLLRGPVLAAAILVFVEVMKELPLTLILQPFNFATLAIKVYSLANADLVAEAAPFALLVMLVGLVPLITINHLMSSGRR
jgi:iron(III) transport system permease protein